MDRTDGGGRLIELDRARSLALLAGQEVGRLAVVDGRLPRIFPVNYVLIGEDIVFRTGRGIVFRNGPDAPVSFEVDGLDRSTRSGWSVVVAGWLETIAPDDPLVVQADHLALQPWASGSRPHWMRVVVGEISGRHVTPDPGGAG